MVGEGGKDGCTNEHSSNEVSSVRFCRSSNSIHFLPDILPVFWQQTWAGELNIYNYFLSVFITCKNKTVKRTNKR